jgi:hypothetical protein
MPHRPQATKNANEVDRTLLEDEDGTPSCARRATTR